MHSQLRKDLGELMRLAQQGDRAAYIELLQEITPRLRHAVRKRMPFLQPQDIDDLVQNILLALHSVRMTYDPRRPFLPWLMGIARNQTAEGARRYARRTASEIGVDVLPETFCGEGANTPEEIYGDADSLRLVVDSLPAGQRQAIDLLKLKEMTLKEAAGASGMSVAALKTATHRAVRSLRKALAGKS